jgi:hypothetical protein
MATPKLVVQSVPFSILLNNDAGSGADKDMATWKPTREIQLNFPGDCPD